MCSVKEKEGKVIVVFHLNTNFQMFHLQSLQKGTTETIFDMQERHFKMNENGFTHIT